MVGLDVLQLDITGRRDFAPGSSRRLAAMTMLQRLPRVVRQSIARVVLGRSLRRTLPYWQMALAAVDAAVLGGGNLLADADLNFPLKVSAVLSTVADAGLPAAVHAVGVSDNWSRGGQTLFRDALSGVRLVHAAVRDEQSREIWIRRLCPSGIAEPQIVRDPGLLASECYPAQARPTTSITRVGICMTHPVALRYHADGAMPSAAAMTAWFVELVEVLTRKGFATFLFTTGSPEDEAYLDRVMPTVLAAVGGAGTVERVTRLKKAADLAGFISTVDLVMAHRLHACIAAYSYEVPNVGFTWDQKMQSFFDSVGRSRYLCAAVSMSAADVVSLAEEALLNGIDAEERRLVIAETQADIAGLLRNLASA
jgi:polysaccharide pyruvyl transferase WcaK-like protein